MGHISELPRELQMHWAAVLKEPASVESTACLGGTGCSRPSVDRDEEPCPIPIVTQVLIMPAS